MSGGVAVPINHAVRRWARESIGVPVDDAAARVVGVKTGPTAGLNPNQAAAVFSSISHPVVSPGAPGHAGLEGKFPPTSVIEVRYPWPLQ